MKLGIISDIHGNQVALEAVLEDCKRNHCDVIVCLGDIANGGPRPIECLQLVQEYCDIVIRGNHEHYSLGNHLPDNWNAHPSWAPLQWTNKIIGDKGIQYMTGLPDTERFTFEDDTSLRFTHAFPESFSGGVFPHSCPEDLSTIFASVSEPYVFVGHTHRASRHVLSDITVVNVGSVGMSFDSPRTAHYAVVEWKNQNVHIDFKAVPFSVATFYEQVRSSSYVPSGGLIARTFVAQVYGGEPLIQKLFEEADLYALANDLNRDDALREMPTPSFLKKLELAAHSG